MGGCCGKLPRFRPLRKGHSPPPPRIPQQEGAPVAQGSNQLNDTPFTGLFTFPNRFPPSSPGAPWNPLPMNHLHSGPYHVSICFQGSPTKWLLWSTHLQHKMWDDTQTGIWEPLVRWVEPGAGSGHIKVQTPMVACAHGLVLSKLHNFLEAQ